MHAHPDAPSPGPPKNADARTTRESRSRRYSIFSGVDFQSASRNFRSMKKSGRVGELAVSKVPTRFDSENVEPTRRGHYQISARLQRALMLLASGRARTQHEACKEAGMSSRALQLALKRPNV